MSAKTAAQLWFWSVRRWIGILKQFSSPSNSHSQFAVPFLVQKAPGSMLQTCGESLETKPRDVVGKLRLGWFMASFVVKSLRHQQESRAEGESNHYSTKTEIKLTKLLSGKKGLRWKKIAVANHTSRPGLSNLCSKKHFYSSSFLLAHGI